VKSEILEKIPDHLLKIAEANSLIAWLREAIKAKEAEMEAVLSMKSDDYIKAENIDCPARPERENYGFVVFDDILATLSIKEREEYYRLETKCAVIGKFIHPDGSFSRARKDFLQERYTRGMSVWENPII